MKVEHVSCYVCGSSDSRLWARESGWTAVRCGGCGLVYVDPRPALETISRATETGAHAGGVDRYRPKKVAFYRDRLANLYEPGYFRTLRGRWLDIGCGYGEFLEALSAASRGALELSGREPNRVKAASARARGLDVRGLDGDLGGAPFRGISLLNVLGHLPDPPSLLRRLRAALAPDGELLLETGNWAELERAEIPDRLNLPDHLSFASEALVRRVLETAGFSVVRVGRFDMFPPGLLEKAARALFAKQARPRAQDLWFRAKPAS